jgi:hypothetical protein
VTERPAAGWGMAARTGLRRFLRQHWVAVVVTLVVWLLIVASGFMSGLAGLVTLVVAGIIEFVHVAVTGFTSLRGQWRRRHGAQARLRRAYAERQRDRR